MKRVIFAGVFLALACAFSVEALAQSTDKFAEYDKYVSLLRKDLRAGKKELIALNMPLTESEATKFWPVYEQFSNDVAKIYDARIALVKEYAANISSLSDSAAASLAKRTLDNDAAMAKLRQQYAPVIGKVLPGKKAALFFQLDKRVGMLIDLQLASEIPLVVQ
jgi:hypothetical protein